MYTLLALLAVLGAYALARLMAPRAGRDGRWWALLAICELGLLYAHNTGPVAFVWVNIVVLAGWLARRSASRPGWRAWAAVQAVVALAWAPYFVTRFLLLPEANASVSAGPLSAADLRDSLSSFFVVPWEAAVEAALPVWPILLLALAVLALVTRSRLRWAPVHLALWCAGILAGLAMLGNEFHGRYFVVASPFVAVMAGAVPLVTRRIRGRGARQFVPVAAACAGIALVTIPQIHFALTTPGYWHDDARAMARHYAQTLDSGDTVLAWSYADRYELAYYWEREGVTARRVTLPEGAGLDAIAPLLPGSGDVSLNVWYTQRADYRGMMPCLLGAGTRRPPVETSVQGMSTLTYDDPSLDIPVPEPFLALLTDVGAPFAQVTGVGPLAGGTADQAVCVPVVLTVTAPTQEELKAALVVRDEAGREVVTATGVFATADQRTSQTADPAELLEAYVLLRLPPGTPPGQYAVSIRVFSEINQPDGYPMEGQATRGRESLVGTWNVIPGAEWSGYPGIGEIAPGPLTLRSLGVSPEGQLRSGTQVTLSLLWEGTGPLPLLNARADDGAWALEIPAAVQVHDDLTRDVRTFIVPGGAPDGTFSVYAGESVLAEGIEVIADPLTYELPPLDQEVNAIFPGVGELVGFRLLTSLTTGENPRVLLAWRGGEAPSDVPLTVFVQMLDASGRVLAQSDAQPAGGARPTTGWRPDEVIEDAHELRYNAPAVPGRVWLIAGLYDPVTFERVPLGNGGDSVMLLELAALDD
jgi:hypothetical protein